MNQGHFFDTVPNRNIRRRISNIYTFADNGDGRSIVLLLYAEFQPFGP